jgi:transcriptional regulator with XRE-family HTH domain
VRTFGELLRELRKQKGLMQRVVAARLKRADGKPVSPQQVNDWEFDRSPPPPRELLDQLAKILGTPVEVLAFHAGELPVTPEKVRGEPSPRRVVAAYEAFRRELRKKDKRK